MRYVCKLCLFAVLFAWIGTTGTAQADKGDLILPAKAYLLMDGASGQVLVDCAGDERFPVASTTKIMTAILAFERGNLQDVVRAGLKPYNTGGVTLYLDLGEELTLEDLLYGLMLESANDAAVAIAEHLAGTEEIFAEWMTQKAHELGATSTQFRNSHGLDEPGHFSTAYDLALIGRYAMSNSQIRDLVAVEEWEIPATRTMSVRKLVSRNRLLGYYPGANGLKNGYTENALLTNVASAKRDEVELFAVVLGAENMLWTTSMALLDYGFDNFTRYVVIKAGELVAPAPVSGGFVPTPAVAKNDLSVLFPTGAGTVTSSIVWAEGLQAPLNAGTYLGELQAVYDGKVIGKVDLVAALSVDRREPIVAGGLNPDAVVASFSFGGNLTWVWPLIFLGLVFMLNTIFRRRWQRTAERGRSDKPFGRERLKAMRERRRT